MWYHDGTGLACLCDLVEYVHILVMELTINDIWSVNGWCFDCLAIQLSLEIQSLIISIAFLDGLSRTNVGVGWAVLVGLTRILLLMSGLYIIIGLLQLMRIGNGFGDSRC